MQRILTAAAVIALGIGTAGITQAQTTPAVAPSTAPSSTMPDQAPGTTSPAMPNAGVPSAAGTPAAGPSAANYPAAAGPSLTLSRQQIEHAQHALRQQGLYHGRIDGLLGRETQQAIAQFQQSQGLQQTATIDQETLNRLMGGSTMGTAPSTGSTMPRAQPLPSGRAGQ